MAEGIGDEVAQDREDQPGINRLAGDEHVVAPDQEAEDGDGQLEERHEVVAEDALAREAGDDFADHPHGRQNHDVDGGMRIEPEHVLEQHRIAAERRVEDADVQQRAPAHQQEAVTAITGVPRIMMTLVA